MSSFVSYLTLSDITTFAQLSLIPEPLVVAVASASLIIITPHLHRTSLSPHLTLASLQSQHGPSANTYSLPHNSLMDMTPFLRVQ